MQVPVKRLLAEIQFCQRFIAKKSTIPILCNVLFEADGSTLTLTATDLEVAGITSVAGTGEAKWACAVPVAKLIQYLTKVDEPEVTIETDDAHWFTVKHGSAATRISGMSRESYPELPAPPAATITLGRIQLAIERASFAISSDASRFTLNGALLEVDEKEAKLVATDGHRLSYAPITSKGGSIKALLPKKAWLEAARLGDECSISEDKDHAFLSFVTRRIVTRKLAGNFPDYRRVLPSEMPNHVLIPVQSTLKTLERVATYADARSHAIRWTIEDSRLVIFASSIETGEATGEVPIVKGEITGTLPFEAGYNAVYIMDFLRATNAQQVGFAFQNDDPPREGGGKSTPAAAKIAVLVTGDGWRYPVMPMRI